MTTILVPGPGRVGRRSGLGGGAPNILVTGSGRVGRRSGPWGRAPNYVASSLARSCPPFQWLLPPKVSLWLESKPFSPEPACCSPRSPTTDSGKPPRQYRISSGGIGSPSALRWRLRCCPSRLPDHFLSLVSLSRLGVLLCLWGEALFGCGFNSLPSSTLLSGQSKS